MSRSFKKTPMSILCADKSFKIIFNRNIRRNKDLDNVLQHNNYKKLNQSYDIVDWKYLEDISKRTLSNLEFKTKKERKAYIKSIICK